MKAASDALCIETKQELLCLYHQGGHTRTGFQSKVQWIKESVTWVDDENRGSFATFQKRIQNIYMN
jgi:hypothetical protein